VRVILAHGQDPTDRLLDHGWAVCRARDVVSESGEKHVLTMTFVVSRPRVVEQALAVERAAAVGSAAAVETQVVAAPEPVEGTAPMRDVDLVTRDGEVPHPYQRVAAYAFVTSRRGVLMTQFSDRTNAPGRWGLPGGGLENQEAPNRAVLREVWEESGQVIVVGELALVRTFRWIGRAPTGRLEDFHSVRLVYRASCHVPTEPVVHDVGGTTASAAWVPPTELDRLDFALSWRSLVSAVVMAPDEADCS